MDPDQLVAEADEAGMNPLQYSHMIMGDRFLDEEFERRVFNPLSLRLHPSTLENLTAYDAGAGITHIKRSVVREREPRVDTHSLLVRARGVYKGDERTPGSGTEAAIGVYFGPESPHNFALRVPTSLSLANRFAEVFAVRMALLRIRDRWRTNYTISSVYVVTDSKYVVEALSEDIDGWRTNGFKNAQGEKVPNHSEIEKLDRLMLELAEDGVEASFWPVDRTENQEADGLARGELGLPPR